MGNLIRQGICSFNGSGIFRRPEKIDFENPSLAIILHGFQRTQIDVHFIAHAKINRPVMAVCR